MPPEGGEDIQIAPVIVLILIQNFIKATGRPSITGYSSAGLGAYFLRNSFGGDTYHKKEFAYQFSFLGIEYGNQFAFFTEFGVGYTGTIVAGGRFRF